MSAQTRRIKIVLLADCLETLAGGAEKQILELVKRLDKERFSVSAVSLECQGKASGELIREAGGNLFVFPVKRIYGLSGFIQGMKFFCFLRREKIDILQTYHFSSDIWGAFWGRLAGVPFIVSNRRDMGFWRKPYHAFLYRLINPFVNKIVVVANAVKQMVMATEGVSPEKIRVIYNGIESPSVSYQLSAVSEKEKLGIKEDEIVIMHVASLKPIKGHTFLFRALSEVVKKFPQVKLVLVGKDELKGKLQKEVEDLGIKKHVLFLGKRSDALSLLMCADICVLPSLSEGMSNAILEYMAAGKPVVATRVGGNPELIHDGHNGFLVEKEDAKSLEAALLFLIENEGKRRLMGENGRRIAEQKFSMQAMVKEYEALFSAKVLHLVSSGGFFGAERVILNLAAQMKDSAIVGVIYNRHNPHLEIIEEAKDRYKTVVFESAGRVDGKTISAIRTFMKKEFIAILHTHNYKSDILGFFATRFTKIKWVATNHVWHGTDMKLRAYEKLDAFLLKFANKVVAVSDEIQNDLLKVGVQKKKTTVIYNGMDISQFKNGTLTRAEFKKHLGLLPDDFVVSIIGRLIKEKGHEVFLQAAREVSEKEKRVKFLIVGDGPLREQLEVLTRELALSDRVIFTGIRKDISSVYGATDVMVNASFIEGLPMTILEAMASKTAIIATEAGAIPKVILNGKNGIIVPAGDSKNLADAILKIISHAEDRSRFTDAAYRDVCANFSAEAMAGHYRKVYEEVLL